MSLEALPKLWVEWIYKIVSIDILHLRRMNNEKIQPTMLDYQENATATK